jgi:hypothetical protein
MVKINYEKKELIYNEQVYSLIALSRDAFESTAIVTDQLGNVYRIEEEFHIGREVITILGPGSYLSGYFHCMFDISKEGKLILTGLGGKELSLELC